MIDIYLTFVLSYNHIDKSSMINKSQSKTNIYNKILSSCDVWGLFKVITIYDSNKHHLLPFILWTLFRYDVLIRVFKTFNILNQVNKFWYMALVECKWMK